jgi:hypothetical protein
MHSTDQGLQLPYSGARQSAFLLENVDSQSDLRHFQTSANALRTAAAALFIASYDNDASH